MLQETPEFINKHLKEFLSSSEGLLVACLVREFLEFFQLDFTLSVFDPETAQGKYYNYGGRSKLMKDLQLQNLNGMCPNRFYFFFA
jgi:FGFR1 oncogene partner